MSTVFQPQFEQTAERYDDYAKQQRMVLERLVNKMKPYLPDAPVVLDAGCGTGYLQRYAKEHDLSWQLRSCDAAFSMCMQAGGVVNARLEQLPYADGSVDGCFSSLVLQWVGRPQKAYAELFRVLKPGGMLAVSTYREGTLYELHDALVAVGYPAQPFMPMHELAEQVRDTGFELVLQEGEQFQTQHSDALALLQEMKGLGANRYYTKGQPVMLPAQLKRLNDAYEGNLASWQLVYLVARKPADG